MEWCHDGLSIFLVLSQAGLLKNSAQGPVMVLGRVFLCEKGRKLCRVFVVNRGASRRDPIRNKEARQTKNYVEIHCGLKIL